MRNRVARHVIPDLADHLLFLVAETHLRHVDLSGGISFWRFFFRKPPNMVPSRTCSGIHCGRSPSWTSGSRAGLVAKVHACMVASSSRTADTAATRSTQVATVPPGTEPCHRPGRVQDQDHPGHDRFGGAGFACRRPRSALCAGWALTHVDGQPFLALEKLICDGAWFAAAGGVERPQPADA